MRISDWSSDVCSSDLRLTKKNIRQLGDRSLLAWTAEAARTSGVIDRLVVSTEDEEVAAAARAIGLEVPFMRPQALARDPAGVVQVALHALETRSEERRGGKECVITCRARWARSN